MFSEKLIGL